MKVKLGKAEVDAIFLIKDKEVSASKEVVRMREALAAIVKALALAGGLEGDGFTVEQEKDGEYYIKTEEEGEA